MKQELSPEDKELWVEALKRVREIHSAMQDRIAEAAQRIQQEHQAQIQATLSVITSVFDRRYRLTEQNLRIDEEGKIVPIQKNKESSSPAD